MSTLPTIIDSGRPSSIGTGGILTGKPRLPDDPTKITFLRWRRTRYKGHHWQTKEELPADPRGTDTSICHAFFPAKTYPSECWKCGDEHDGPESHDYKPHKTLCGIRQWLTHPTIAAYEIIRRPPEGAVCKLCLFQLHKIDLPPFWFDSNE